MTVDQDIVVGAGMAGLPSPQQRFRSRRRGQPGDTPLETLNAVHAFDSRSERQSNQLIHDCVPTSQLVPTPLALAMDSRGWQ